MYSIFNTSHYTKTQFCGYTRNLQYLMSAVEVFFLCVCVSLLAPLSILTSSTSLNLSTFAHSPPDWN